MSRKITSILFVIAGIAGACFLYNRYRIAPDIQEKNVVFLKDSAPVSLNTLTGEDIAIVFYAHWCGPCMAEMKDLTALHPELQSKGLRVVALTDDTPELIEKVRQGHGIPFEMYPLDGTLNDYGIYTIPTAYVFDQNGTLVFEQVDKWDWTNADFLTQLFDDLN